MSPAVELAIALPVCLAIFYGWVRLTLWTFGGPR